MIDFEFIKIWNDLYGMGWKNKIKQRDLLSSLNSKIQTNYA